ncbi:uncharacterized protein LOC119305294 isoform X1 [Triticum dicoccoides]|uniref:uncharacterized protein LOC119305294 isoform X1 n=1 Tax=Triticum dicoccoides TaxID=85692 RepID=UPI00188EBF4C|nr:uncharacterized protein LOC119305294 isoform X1 [Triticum dicoccoides]
MGGRRDHGQCPAEVVLHLRRLDALLKDHGLDHTAHTLEMEAGLFFEAAHLEQLVRQGLWASAHRYLRRFSALWDGDGAATQYATLLSSLSHHSILAWLACRGDEGGRAASFLRPSDEAIRTACPEEARRKDMYCSMTSQQARASVNWEDIKLETLTRVQELVDLRPNLDCLLKNRLPRHKPTPQDVIPLGILTSLRGSQRYRRKRVNHKPACDLAYFVLHKRLPDISLVPDCN